MRVSVVSVTKPAQLKVEFLALKLRHKASEAQWRHSMTGRHPDTTITNPSINASASRQTPRPRLVIGPDVKISGKDLAIETVGIVQVDGEITGDIHAYQVIINESGTVRGAICSDEVRVHGNVTGSIKARYVTLQPCCVVTGKIFHQSLTINTGARFDGTVRRDEELSSYGAQHTRDPIAELLSFKDRRPRVEVIDPQRRT